MYCHQTLAHFNQLFVMFFLPVFAYIFRKTIRCWLDRVVRRAATLLTCVASVLLQTELLPQSLMRKGRFASVIHCM